MNRAPEICLVLFVTAVVVFLSVHTGSKTKPVKLDTVEISAEPAPPQGERRP